ncbi:hypothetical protein CAQU_00330 [Corynebacterium aquilae DSM 44791]|uniref:DNA-3-methyladenine glycosylase I n=1 Tax=Corynebacterium aquilae DSM 44791 TaxID=1431546 RepID=A0A1L7CD68_9CORY|nr:hypothetical protein CAQU_00330 [Corynebacterium aquilae DSM 44791]
MQPGQSCPVTGLIRGEDGVFRPGWANTEELACYYDTEWGISACGSGAAALTHLSENALFERLCLESFQAGLSWATILRKRPALRQAFHNFDVDQVAAMDDDDVASLMDNPAILRNRAKIQAVIGNARATIALRAHGGLGEFMAPYCPPPAPAPRCVDEIASRSAESAALAKALKEKGFSFVGPTTMYALFQALGVVNDRVPAP